MGGNPKRDALEHALDEALVESFPASDPIAVHAEVEEERKPLRAGARPRKQGDPGSRRKQPPGLNRKTRGKKRRR